MTICQTCEQPVAYVPSGTYTLGSFAHTDGSDDHKATPKSQCPKCGSFDYVHDETDPWANYDRCGACKYVHRVSLGD